MVILSELVSVVIGVDPDKARIHAAIVDAKTAGELDHESFPNNPDGHNDAMEWADSHSEASERAWAIEGSASYGARLSRSLRAASELVLEFSFPSGPATPDGAKSDHLDALRAAREALGRTKQAKPRPATNNDTHGSIRALVASRNALVRQRTAMINTLKAILMAGPETLLTDLEHLTTTALVKRCTNLRPTPNPAPTDEVAATKLALRCPARSIREIDQAIKDLNTAIEAHVTNVAPALLDQIGVGPITAADLLVAWGHQGRIHSADAWAKLAGTAPIPATSGQQQTKHRLNPRGDRNLNSALHTIALTRSRHDPRTKTYIAQKISEGKTPRDARRCLKRYIGRNLYRILENPPQPLDRT